MGGIPKDKKGAPEFDGGRCQGGVIRIRRAKLVFSLLRAKNEVSAFRIKRGGIFKWPHPRRDGTYLYRETRNKEKLEFDLDSQG